MAASPLPLNATAHVWVAPLQGDLVVGGVVASPWALNPLLMTTTPPSILPALPGILDALVAPLYQMYLQVCSFADLCSQIQASMPDN
jgi:hypothetical protein